MKSLVIVLALSLLSVAWGAENSTRMVGSVATINIARPPHWDFVTVHLRIHRPAELSGATLVLITDTKDRGHVRSQMPLGSLQEVLLPAALVLDLRKQHEHQERFERSVDRGIRPEMISEFVPLTQVRLADLPAPVTPFPLNPPAPHSAASPSAASPAPKAKTIEERLRAIEDYVAEGTPTEPPEVTSPKLTQLALEELLRRLPAAQKPAPKIQFVSAGMAIVSIRYALPGSAAPQTQEIHCFYEKGVWTLFWMPENPEKKADPSPAGTR